MEFREENGMFTGSLQLVDRASREWVAYLRQRGFALEQIAEDVLMRAPWPAHQHGQFDIAIVPGRHVLGRENSFSRMRSHAWNHGAYSTATVVHACLLRDSVTFDDMRRMEFHRIRVVTDPLFSMHHSDDNFFFELDRDGGKDWLNPLAVKKSVAQENTGYAFVRPSHQSS